MSDSRDSGSAGWEGRVDEAVARIVRRSTQRVVGCSPEELEAFQSARGIELPAAYLQYLRQVGGASSFLSGSALSFAELPELQTSARSLLADADGPKLPRDAFVFVVHQGYQFLFFALNGNPDPEVLHYLEGERAFRVVAGSFSEWVRTSCEEFPPD